MAPVLPPCPQSPLPMGCPHATISGASLRSGGPGEERWLSREALLHVSQPQEALEQDQQEAGGVLKTPALPRPHLSRSLTLGARQLGPNLWPPGLTGSPITAASPYPPAQASSYSWISGTWRNWGLSSLCREFSRRCPETAQVTPGLRMGSRR